jgi:hypothetical protein
VRSRFRTVHALFGELDVADDRDEEVVEVVGDAGRQLPQGFELLSALAAGFGLFALSDVDGRTEELHDVAVCVADGLPFGEHPAHLPTGQHDAKQLVGIDARPFSYRNPLDEAHSIRRVNEAQHVRKGHRVVVQRPFEQATQVGVLFDPIAVDLPGPMPNPPRFYGFLERKPQLPTRVDGCIRCVVGGWGTVAAHGPTLQGNWGLILPPGHQAVWTIAE